MNPSSQSLVPDIEGVLSFAPAPPRPAAAPLPETASRVTALAPAPSHQPTFALAENAPDALIAHAVREKMPIDYLRELFALKKEVDAHQAFAAFQDARASFAAEAITVLKKKHVFFPTKDRDGKVTGSVDYWHAELSDVVAAVAPALGRYGLSYSWETDFTEYGVRVTVTCVLRHRLGHSERVTMSGPLDDSGKKNILQQQQSTVTYLQRHTLKAITGVAEAGDDDDGRTGRGEGPPAEYSRNLGRRAGAAPAETMNEPVNEGEREALIQTGEDKALGGMAELAPWWQSLSARERNLIGGGYGPLKTAAARVDADRAAGKGLHDEPGQRP